MGARRKAIPVDSLLQLRQPLDHLPRKSPKRTAQIAAVAELYGVSTATVYRALHVFQNPHAAHRAHHGSRVCCHKRNRSYCELIAALKLRTTNKQGRHLSTERAIGLLEDYGVETAQGLVKVPKGLLRRPTVKSVPVLVAPGPAPPVTRTAGRALQAEYSNDCWHFDMSPSDLKHIDKPDWIDPAKGEPTLMLFSVLDDRSGVGYQEYRCVYGERQDRDLATAAADAGE